VKETRDEFYARSFGRKDGSFLVWKTPEHKQREDSKTKPERWDHETVQNYLMWLEDENGRKTSSR
jgi:hypothetical protein